MSNERKPIMSLVVPSKTDRQVLVDLAHVMDSMRDGIYHLHAAVEEVRGDVAEIKGHMIRVDSTTRQVSSHDLEQDAKLAELHVRVETVETGWQRFGRHVVSFYESPRTKLVGKTLFGAAMVYAAGKETGLLHAIYVALQSAGVVP